MCWVVLGFGEHASTATAQSAGRQSLGAASTPRCCGNGGPRVAAQILSKSVSAFTLCFGPQFKPKMCELVSCYSPVSVRSMSVKIVSVLVRLKRFSCPPQLGTHPGESEYFRKAFPGWESHFHFQSCWVPVTLLFLWYAPIIPCTLFVCHMDNKCVLFQIPRMAFRRPPPDVDRMTSLRVGNLPYSVVIEVGDRHLLWKAPAFSES